MLTINDKISANTIASHIPFSPQNTGNINIAITWNTSVRKKDITAETSPLFKAVKNAEANILNPLIINASFVKPLDQDMLSELVNDGYDIITIER